MPSVSRSVIQVAIAVALASCGSSSGSGQSTPDQVNARRFAAVQNSITSRVQALAARCHEPPVQIMSLLTRDTTFTALINGVQLPMAGLLNAFDSATVRHDATKPCAATIDSLIAALHR